MQLVEAYQQCPSNYCHSFTREQFKQIQNLPSEDFYPAMNSSGIAFDDIYPSWRDQVKNIEYPIKPALAKFVRHLTFMKATGIPIPEQGRVDRKTQITARELRVVLLNKTSGRFIGSTMIFPAKWNESYEDWWTFEGESKNDNSLILKLAEYDVNVDNGFSRKNIYLIFELVCYFKKNNIELQMSCGWGMLSLKQMSQNGTHSVPLLGGSPLNNTGILPSEILSKRGTFVGKVAKLFSGVKSIIQVTVATADRLGLPFERNIDLLPRNCIICHNAVAIARAYRLYLGYNAYFKGRINTSLAIDPVVKSFLRSMNLKSLQLALCKLWNSDVEYF